MGKEFTYRSSDAQHSEPELSQTVPQQQALLPNSVVMRMMDDPDAEDEAIRLSARITSGTPNALKKDFGSRLGADFSGIRFHNDRASVQRSIAMGARAWTQGKDIYFGKGGYSPAVAAHELVHTIQQGAASGNVSESVPYGTIQRLDDDEDDAGNVAAPVSLRNADEPTVEGAVSSSFQTPMGSKVYSGIEGKIKDWIKKGTTKKKINYDKARGISFMVRTLYNDYLTRDILTEVAEKPIATKNDVSEREREYRALMKNAWDRTGSYELEITAEDTGILDSAEGEQQAETPQHPLQMAPDTWQQSVSFNPTNRRALAKVQAEIDQAATAEEAFKAFSRFNGNSDAKFVDKKKEFTFIDALPDAMATFRARLKQMARMVQDYPELRNRIGNMEVLTKNPNAIMSVSSKVVDKDTIKYNPYLTQVEDDFNEYLLHNDPSIDEDWLNRRDEEIRNFHGYGREFDGTHELGHLLAKKLIDPKHGDQDLQKVWMLPEHNVIKNAIKDPNNAADLSAAYPGAKLQYHRDTRMPQKGDESNRWLKNTIDIAPWAQAGATSGYGATNQAEFFAEAFADVYAHGNQAKVMSQKIIQEYEKEQKQKQREKFDHDKLSRWEKFKRFLFRK